MVVFDRNFIVEAFSRFVSTSKVWLKKTGLEKQGLLVVTGFFFGVGALLQLLRLEAGRNRFSESAFRAEFLEKNSIVVHDEAAIAAQYIGEEAKAEHRVRAVI